MAGRYDVAVIGAGPAGYVAALRCAQLGMRVVSIDAWQNLAGAPSLGGTCLNAGCIPSKALLESSENYARAAHNFAAHGVRIGSLELDLTTLIARKDKIVETLTKGVALLLKKNKVDSVHGRGYLAACGETCRIGIDGRKNNGAIEARDVIIATGSVAARLAIATPDNRCIVDSTGALAFDCVPQRLGVIGAGIIGLELGSVWRRLGSQVTLLEALGDILPNADQQVAKLALRLFTTRQGLDIKLGCEVSAARTDGETVEVQYRSKQGVEKQVFDKLIVAVGRCPVSAGLGLENVGVKTNATGFIEVDAQCRTGNPNIYAIGDVVRGPMLAHKAMEEGIAVAETIAGQAGTVNLATIPWVIYTAPEIAWVGKTEQELKTAGRSYRIGSFPFSANGRAHALGETEGFVKILAERESDQVLGVHIIGVFASEMIAEAVVAMQFGASSEDIARTVHAHPTLSEAFHEAALGIDKRSLHS
ncbi:MAG: dihydrolipoyl dehydrogenase [Burkholderiales bacterium]